jgi:thioredoxin-dependent peroxiredoxin
MYQTVALALTFLAGALLSAVAWAQAAPAPEAEPTKVVLKEGDKAPDFKYPAGKTEDGADKMVKLSDFKGKKNVLLAFYPKADTPGCTRQLCGYRDDFEQFKSADTEVIAISTDQQDESTAFKDKFELPFAVIGDPSHVVVDKYGVPKMEHGGAALARRAVVLIDKEGVIQHIDMDYNIEQDKDPLYARIEEINQEAAEG